MNEKINVDKELKDIEKDSIEKGNKYGINEIHSNIPERYVDGIGKIHFIGGMIRFDLFSYQPPADGTENPQGAIVERLVLSPNGFLATFDAINNMIEKFKKAGILEQRQDEINESQSSNNEEINEPKVETMNESK